MPKIVRAGLDLDAINIRTQLARTYANQGRPVPPAVEEHFDGVPHLLAAVKKLTDEPQQTSPDTVRAGLDVDAALARKEQAYNQLADSSPLPAAVRQHFNYDMPALLTVLKRLAEEPAARPDVPTLIVQFESPAAEARFEQRHAAARDAATTLERVARHMIVEAGHDVTRVESAAHLTRQATEGAIEAMAQCGCLNDMLADATVLVTELTLRLAARQQDNAGEAR